MQVNESGPELRCDIQHERVSSHTGEWDDTYTQTRSGRFLSLPRSMQEKELTPSCWAGAGQ